MQLEAHKDPGSVATVRQAGFTLIEVIVAGSLMIVLSVGTLTVFSHAVRINRGNNLRSQAQSILQQEVEFYRSLKFVPGKGTSEDLPNHRNAYLGAGNHTRPQKTSPDGRVFNISVTVTNLPTPASPSPDGILEERCRFKEITITATPAVAETGWLADLKTQVTIQRVRTN